MTSVSLLLVVLSAFAHASWNLMLKRAGDPEVFAWCLLAVSTVVLAPVGVVLLWLNPVGFPGMWFALATIVLHTFYFVLLGRGYAQGDLSLVYPVARGMGPMLTPLLAVIFINEVHRTACHSWNLHHHLRDIHNLMVGQLQSSAAEPFALPQINRNALRSAHRIYHSRLFYRR